MRAPIAAVLLLALATTPSLEAADPAALDEAAGDRVAVLSRDDPAYREIQVPDRARIAADAPMRLLVFLGGSCTVDRGLRDERSQEPAEGGGTEQRGITERAFVSVDSRVAVVETIRYVDREQAEPGANAAPAETIRGETELTWVDPYHPGGKWVVKLEPGRWVKKAIPMARRRGVALTTYRRIAGESDFRLLGPDGKESVRIPEEDAWTLDLQGSSDGRFVAIDQGFSSRPGRPDRGVLVLDVAGGSRWSYTWEYGGDDEPTSWRLEDGGVLVIVRPGGKTQRFAADGKPLR